MPIKTNKQKKQEKELQEQERIKQTAAGTLASGDYAGRVKTNYQIGNTIFPNAESYEQAKRLIEVRTPSNTKQFAAGDVKPEVQQAVEASNLFEAQQGRATQPQLNAILEREKQKTNENLPEFEVASANMPSNELPVEERQKLIGKSQGIGLEGQTATEQSQEMFNAKTQVVAGIGKEFFGNAARLIDTIRTGITGKKPRPVQIAEQTFSDATNTLRLELESVKAGTASPDEVLRDYNRAIEAINMLESETKLQGQVNTNYWISKGKEIETTLANEKAIIENLRDELNAAILRRRLGI